MNNIGLSYLPFTGAYSIVVDMSQAKPGERVYLPDTPVLSDKFITGVFAFWSYDGNIQDPDGNLIDGNRLYYMNLTLVDLENDDFISNVPLVYFSFGGRQIPVNRYLVLPNCYITNNYAASPANHIMLTFFYTSKVENNVLSPVRKLRIQSMNIPVYSNSANRYYLPDNRVLVDKKFRNIYSTSVFVNTTTPSVKEIVAPDNSFLTLVLRSDIILYRFPVLYLSQWNFPFKLNMDNLQADLPSSYIELSQNIAKTVGDKVVFLNFEYED